jgi:hypothetical protein
MTQWSVSAVLVSSAVASVVVARDHAQPPPQCEKVMTAFCNGPALEQCIKVIKAKGGATPLVALFDSNPDHAAAAWRCYSPTSLTPDRSAYVTIAIAGSCTTTVSVAFSSILECCHCFFSFLFCA